MAQNRPKNGKLSKRVEKISKNHKKKKINKNKNIFGHKNGPKWPKIAPKNGKLSKRVEKIRKNS